MFLWDECWLSTWEIVMVCVSCTDTHAHDDIHAQWSSWPLCLTSIETTQLCGTRITLSLLLEIWAPDVWVVICEQKSAKFCVCNCLSYVKTALSWTSQGRNKNEKSWSRGVQRGGRNREMALLTFSELFSHLISQPMWHKETAFKKYKYLLMFVLALVGDRWDNSVSAWQ